ncbi:protein kinase domain-containing protein [Streptomyces sp. G45]|uniref:serine/threonine-protein kinase n=1 Tax=Streptomyces sp. G45 TaxID=3406627 RepID=UPI003C298DC4
MSSGDQEQADGTGRLLAGRYRVLGQLGRGGMGVVWRAVDEVLHREVAVKELRTYTDTAGPELADLRLRMQREARAAARVRHPGVVAVHDVAEVDGRPLIVMELVDGPSLDDVLRERGTLDPGAAAAIGAKVMDALAAAHRAGVLHRDVKPGNILLGTGGRVVLTDFGIATMDDPGDGSATHLTRSGELVGSLDYLAPERAQGQEPGPASDVWALGATLYAAVEGASPFRRTSTWSTLTAIVVEPLPEPRRAGPLAPALRQLMDKDPGARPDADAARRLLEAVASGAPLPSPAPAPGGRIPREPTELHVPSAPPPGFGPPQPPAYGAAQSPEYGAAQPAPYGPAPTAPEPTRAAAARSRRAQGKGRSTALLAAAAVAAVLAATGVTVAALGGGDDKDSAAQGTDEPDATAEPGSAASRGTLGDDHDAEPSEQGDATSKAPRKDRDADTGDKDGRGGRDGDEGKDRGDGDKKPSTGRDSSDEPDARPSASASKPPKGGGSSGGSETPACHPAGGGKYDCTVWRTATSYTAAGAQAGVLNAGTNYFYCQRNLGRRETSGRWTNVWWARTDDDSGNRNVYISDVYIQGGENDKPVPGLPVC